MSLGRYLQQGKQEIFIGKGLVLKAISLPFCDAKVCTSPHKDKMEPPLGMEVIFLTAFRLAQTVCWLVFR